MTTKGNFSYPAAAIVCALLLSPNFANAQPPTAKVEVINVPGVIVENLPDTQAVEVKNLPATQAVVDRNAPAANPFQVNEADFRHNTNFTLAQFEPIPDGFRAVIEDVSASAFRSDDNTSGSRLAYCEISIRDEFNARLFTRFLRRANSIEFSVGQNSMANTEVVSERVTVYVEPGQKPWVECTWLASGDTVRLDASISGYLLPLD